MSNNRRSMVLIAICAAQMALPGSEKRTTSAVNAFLEGKIKAAAALPAPTSLAYFEGRRAAQMLEFYRYLGLDPLPPRTPLNARVTGILERPGYRIEKIVFESRPDFPVTAHLYVPAGPAGRKLPVIVNPHGHWGYKKNEPTVQSAHRASPPGISRPGRGFPGIQLRGG